MNCTLITTYERDNETDLDFAQARIHNYSLGRFTSPDPLYFTADRPSDPQQFNLYLYVRNNPLKFVDPSGEDYVGTDGKKVEVEYLRNKKGKIIGIKNIGKNATKNLRKLVSLIDKYKSAEALSDFINGNQSSTRININLNISGPSQAGAHDKLGRTLGDKGFTKPEYIKDSKTGFWAYKEVTIDINVGSFLLKAVNPDDPNSKGFKELIEDECDVSNVTQDEYTLATFGHEINHALGPNNVAANRRIFKNKKLTKEQRGIKLKEHYDLVGEPKAKARTQKILNEIKKFQKNPMR